MNNKLKKSLVSCFRNDNEQPLLRMNWHLLDWCNYQCKYCSAGNVITKDFADKEKVTKQYKMILSRLKLIDEPFELCITGGEPSLHPHLKEIIENLHQNKNLESIFLFTNLSRSRDFYRELTNISDKIVTYASYHPEYYNKDFLNKCIDLKFEVHVTLIDEKKYWNQTEDFLNVLNENNIPYRINVLAPAPNWTPNYNEEFWNIFKKYAMENYTLHLTLKYDDGSFDIVTEYELEEKKLNKFKGWKCTPQSYQIEIDGTIRNVCTGKSMPINLNSKNIKQEVICPLDFCSNGKLMYGKTNPSDHT